MTPDLFQHLVFAFVRLDDWEVLCTASHRFRKRITSIQYSMPNSTKYSIEVDHHRITHATRFLFPARSMINYSFAFNSAKWFIRWLKPTWHNSAEILRFAYANITMLPQTEWSKKYIFASLFCVCIFWLCLYLGVLIEFRGANTMSAHLDVIMMLNVMRRYVLIIMQLP